MNTSNCKISEELIKKLIMTNKNCVFNFKPVLVEDVRKLMASVKSDKQFGMDNLDGRLIRLTADYIAEPVCHVFNLSLK